jgi:hypothetical protein
MLLKRAHAVDILDRQTPRVSLSLGRIDGVSIWGVFNYIVMTYNNP